MHLQANGAAFLLTAGRIELVREVPTLIHLRRFHPLPICDFRFTLPLRGCFIPCSWIDVGRSVVRGLSESVQAPPFRRRPRCTPSPVPVPRVPGVVLRYWYPCASIIAV